MYKLKESAETILVLDKWSVKEQKRLNRTGSIASLQKHIGKISQEMLQGKNYQEVLSNTENKSQLLKKFNKYLNILKSSTKDTVLISQYQQ